MAFADLTPDQREGLNYAASVEFVPGSDPPVHFATGREYMDYLGAHDGDLWFGRKVADRKARRAAKLEDARNAALAAQVDAAPGG